MTSYSNSYIRRYQLCPLSCYYDYELKLRKREEGSERHHMAFSKAFHAGVEVLYRAQLNGTLKPLKPLEPIINEAVKAFREGYPRQLDEWDLAKTQPHGVLALVDYAKRWCREDQQKYRMLAVETMDHQEDGFVVKLDRVVQDIETGQIFGVDTKVTGKYINFDFWRQFEPNSQIVEYSRYVEQKFGFCDGFIIDAVSVRHRQRASKDGPAGPWWKFERQTFKVNEQQMSKDLESRQFWADRIEHSKATGQWGLNTGACYFCEYRDLCKAGWFWPEDEELIEINYHRICGRWFGEPLQQCNDDLGHEGEHRVVQSDAPMEIEVEV